MLDKLKPIAIFAKTVQCGSFRKAAADLQLAPSVVSHHISQLEERLGVALLYRSTRKLSLTRDGEKLIEPAIAMLEAANVGINSVMDRQDELSGELRVTAPALLARSQFTKQITDFMHRHKKVKLSLDYSEAPRNIIADGYDVAIRIGWLRDSQLKARKLGEEERVIIVAEHYLKGRNPPSHPEDIEDWDWLELTPVPLRPKFNGPDGAKVSIKPQARLSANNAAALYNLVRNGSGLAILPRFLAQEDLQAGNLRILLPEWKLDSIGIYAVRPHNSPRNSLASEFINAIQGTAKSGLSEN